MSKRLRIYFWVGLPVFLITIAVAAGIGIYKYGEKASNPEISEVTATPTPPSPEPTAVPKPDRAKLKIQVLNGRGVAGVANEAKELLETLGYTDIVTGNADTYDFNNTEVAVKKDQEQYSQLLIDDLTPAYEATESSQELDADSDFDAVVVIGEK